MNLIIVLSVPFFFLLILIEVVYAYKKGIKWYSFKDTLTCIGTGILNQVNTLIATPLFYFLYALTIEKIPLATKLNTYYSTDITTPVGLLSWVFGFVLTDFLYYWYHRHSHLINIMWMSHIVHHSSEKYNLAVALRQPAFSFLVSFQYPFIAALLGLPIEIYFTSFAINLLYQFWIHTEGIKKLPTWFEYHLNTPSHHRVHHSREEHYLDCNYAGVFMWWDRLFNSFKEEKSATKYGVYPRFKEHNAVTANIYPIQDLWQKVRVAGWRYLFKSPLELYQALQNKNQVILKQASESTTQSVTKALSFFLLSLVATLVVLLVAPKLPTMVVIAVFISVWVLVYLTGLGLRNSVDFSFVKKNLN